VRGGGIKGGEVEIDGDISSQFISSLLISTPRAHGDTTLNVAGAVSKPYIDATLETLEKFSGRVRRNGYEMFFIEGDQDYGPVYFSVPGDFSSASFIMAAVAIAGGEVKVKGLNFDLPQGDSFFVEILRKLGVQVRLYTDSLLVRSDGGQIGGGTFDLMDTPDLLPVLSVLALRASEPMTIVGVAHARFKETDRIAVVAKEISKLGAKVEETPDGCTIFPPRRLTPGQLDAHDDHRFFMAFALASMLLPEGLAVEGVESIDVSYPAFLADIKRLGARERRIS
jgi:3-phosphoshikimate 1-carboxyvinyltransferase